MDKSTVAIIVVAAFLLAGFYDYYQYAQKRLKKIINVQVQEEFKETASASFYLPTSTGESDLSTLYHSRNNALLIQYDNHLCIQPSEYEFALFNIYDERIEPTYQVVCFDAECDDKYLLFDNLQDDIYGLEWLDFSGNQRYIETKIEGATTFLTLSGIQQDYIESMTKTEKEYVIKTNLLDASVGKTITIHYQKPYGECPSYSFKIVNNEENVSYVLLQKLGEDGYFEGKDNSSQFTQIISALNELEELGAKSTIDDYYCGANNSEVLRIESYNHYIEYRNGACSTQPKFIDKIESIIDAYF